MAGMRRTETFIVKVFLNQTDAPSMMPGQIVHARTGKSFGFREIRNLGPDVERFLQSCPSPDEEADRKGEC